MIKPKKKRNPQDATLRNVRAANKRIRELEFQVECLATAGAEMGRIVAIIFVRLEKLEKKRGKK